MECSCSYWACSRGLLNSSSITRGWDSPAHLEGVMNGTFLIAFGAVWTEVLPMHIDKTAPVWSFERHWTGLRSCGELERHV
jgi:hypothetical protein